MRFGSSAPRFTSWCRRLSAAVTAVPTHVPLPHAQRGAVPPNIWRKTNTNLYNTPAHPLDTLRRDIETHLHSTHPSLFTTPSSLSPIVTATQCFDDLLVPSTHPSRSYTDTYYIDQHTLLRPHMTAHDSHCLRNGLQAAILCGDVYRRDSVDRTHYPIFHQLDAYRLYSPDTSRDVITADLKHVLEALAHRLFGRQAQLRWVDAYFPFTNPSFELEVWWRDEWLEVLGCGLLHRGVLRRAGIPDNVNGWAFGLGLERLAMVLFDIPDIRLFWSTDPRFLNQFSDASIQQTFKPFSVYPGVEKDMSFWLNDHFHHNDFHQTVRAVAGDLVESVNVIDRFEKAGRTSLCYRIMFRSLERTLTHTEVNELFEKLRDSVQNNLAVQLR